MSLIIRHPAGDVGNRIVGSTPSFREAQVEVPRCHRCIEIGLAQESLVQGDAHRSQMALNVVFNRRMYCIAWEVER